MALALRPHFPPAAGVQFMMSQDTDVMQVVWADSPGSSSQPRACGRSNLGCTAGGSHERLAIKQRLISIAKRPGDVRRPGGTAGALFAAGGGASGSVAGAARLMRSEQLLEGLLARTQQPAVAGTAGAAAAQGQTALSGGPSDLGASIGGGGPHRTPGTQLRSILKRNGVGPAGSASRHTPASSVHFSLAGSSTSKTGRRAGAGRVSGARACRQRRSLAGNCMRRSLALRIPCHRRGLYDLQKRWPLACCLTPAAGQQRQEAAGGAEAQGAAGAAGAGGEPGAQRGQRENRRGRVRRVARRDSGSRRGCLCHSKGW